MSEEPDIQPKSENKEPEEAEQEMKRLSRRGFFWAAVALCGAYETYHWLNQQKPLQIGPDTNDGITWPLRRVLQLDDRVTKGLFAPSQLSPTYSDSAITEARLNGDEGLNEDFDPATWKLHLVGARGPAEQVLDIDEIKSLPKLEYVAEFKCIEGWNFFMKWAGARFADFYSKFPPAHAADYVSMETPDGGYYVSIDMPAALHPQTMLCYEMNGQPLAVEHGAPDPAHHSSQIRSQEHQTDR